MLKIFYVGNIGSLEPGGKSKHNVLDEMIPYLLRLSFGATVGILIPRCQMAPETGVCSVEQFLGPTI